MKSDPGELRPGEDGYKVHMELDWTRCRRERGKVWAGLGIVVLGLVVIGMLIGGVSCG